MMKLITPLGLIALLSIAVLIIIYIIKPNFQQKRVSSTYIWKLSLKYKKKKIPISKLRNILIIVCQILILTSCAIILAQPNRILKAQVESAEVIAVIDSSASMRTVTDDKSRYDRAVNRVLSDFDALPQDGVMSIVIANTNPYVLLEKVGSSNRADLYSALQGLLNDELSCSYGSADIESAMFLCENFLQDNPSAKIRLYTDQDYYFVAEGIEVVNVAANGEWNAAILNAYAKFEGGRYSFYAEIACYGTDEDIKITLTVQNANNNIAMPLTFQTIAQCEGDVTKTVVFKYFSAQGSEEDIAYYNKDPNTVLCIIDSILSYDSVNISLDVIDSFAEDNSIDIYGGQKQILRVQYATTMPNPFFANILFAFQAVYSDRWDVRIVEVAKGDFALSGFDLYIFEHQMPPVMPIDGVVFLVNPDNAPSESGLTFGKMVEVPNGIALTDDETHPILSKVVTSNIEVTQYIPVKEYDHNYRVLMRCNDDPVLLISEEEDLRVVVMSFSVHFSNLAGTAEFPYMVEGIFEHFLPATVVGNAFEVYQTISLRARGPQLNVTGYNYQQILTSFPSILKMTVPGSYNLSQVTYTGKEVLETIYVKIPAAESNIWAVGDRLERPQNTDPDDFLKDLLLFIAAALVAILFIERVLHSREQV